MQQDLAAFACSEAPRSTDLQGVGLPIEVNAGFERFLRLNNRGNEPRGNSGDLTRLQLWLDFETFKCVGVEFYETVVGKNLQRLLGEAQIPPGVGSARDQAFDLQGIQQVVDVGAAEPEGTGNLAVAGITAVSGAKTDCEPEDLPLAR